MAPEPELRALLERAGYHEHPCHEKHRDALWQKCIRDEQGRRYSVTLWGFDPDRMPEGIAQWRWMAEVYIREPHLTFQQHVGEISSPAALRLIEERAHTFWHAMGRPYYEKYQEASSDTE